MSIFAFEKAIEKGLDLIDDAFTSKEEQSVIDNQRTKANTDAKVELLRAYHPFKRAQRLLAALFCIPYMILMTIGVIAILTNAVEFEAVERAIAFTNEMQLGWIVLLIVAFYFGGGAIESIKRKVN